MDRSLFLLAIITLSSSLANRVYSQDYKNEMVISISHRVVTEGMNIERFKDRLKFFFTEVSHKLYEATYKTMFFTSIHILVPNSWPQDSSVKNQSENYQDSHVRIDTLNPLSKNEIYTQQPRGCGHPGNYIHFPYDLINNWVKPDTKLVRKFVQEWAKLKYGVFEETGHVNDTLFPDSYVSRDGKRQKTGCVNPNPWVLEQCNSTDSCDFATNNSVGLLQSSIMDDINLNTSFFCDNTTSHMHNIDAPTRHNILCGGKSTWDVISEVENSSLTVIPEWRFPDFQFIRAQSGVILIIDTSTAKDFQIGHHPLRSSIFKFINDFPYSAKMAVVLVEDKEKFVHYSGYITDEDSKNTFKKEIRRMIQNVKNSQFNISTPLAINYAEKLMENEMKGSNSIILITNGQNFEPGETLPLFFNITDNYNVKVLLITCSQPNNAKSKKFDYHPNQTEIEEMSKHKKRFAWFNPSNDLTARCDFPFLIEMEEIFHWYFDNFIEENYYSKRMKLHSSEDSGSGNFTVSENKTVEFTIYICPLISAVEKDEYKLSVNELNQILGEITVDRDGYISYKMNVTTTSVDYAWIIDNKSGSNLTNVSTTVWMITDTEDKTNEEPILKGDIVINFNKESLQQVPPIQIYAYYASINGTNITAVVTSNNDVKNTTLNDAGNLDPDIRTKDGIYSGYLDTSIESGIYSVSLQTDNQKTDLGLMYFPANDLKSLPPSRVIDLKLSNNTNNKIAELEWTASTNYYNRSKVREYNIICDPKRENVTRGVGSIEKIYNLNDTQAEENILTFQLNITESNMAYFCAVWGENGNNKSFHSNIIIVYISEDPSTEPTTLESLNNGTSTEESENVTATTTPVGEPNSFESTTIASELPSTEAEVYTTTESEATSKVSDSPSSTELLSNISEVSPYETTVTTAKTFDQLTTSLAENEDSEKTLSNAEIGGIVAGVIILLTIIAILLLICYRRYRNPNKRRKRPKLFSHLSVVSKPSNRSDIIRDQNGRSSIRTISDSDGYFPGPSTKTGLKEVDENGFATLTPSPRLMRQHQRIPIGTKTNVRNGNVSTPAAKYELPVNMLRQSRHQVSVEPPEVPKKIFIPENDPREAVMEELNDKVERSHLRVRNRDVTEV